MNTYDSQPGHIGGTHNPKALAKYVKFHRDRDARILKSDEVARSKKVDPTGVATTLEMATAKLRAARLALR